MSKIIQSGGFDFPDILDLIDPKIYGKGTLTSNEIKDIMEVTKYSENIKRFIKRNSYKNCWSKRRISEFSQAINDSWFNINEKCTYSIS